MNCEHEEHPDANILNLLYFQGGYSKIVDVTCRLFNELNPHLPPISNGKVKRIERIILCYGKVKVKKNVPKPGTGDDDNQVNKHMFLNPFNIFSEFNFVNIKEDLQFHSKMCWGGEN